MTLEPRPRNVVLLGTAQTLAWASTYYLPAVLGAAMARDTGVEAPTVFLAFTMALLVSAAFGPGSGRLIDRHGGRPVLIRARQLYHDREEITVFAHALK